MDKSKLEIHKSSLSMGAVVVIFFVIYFIILAIFISLALFVVKPTLEKLAQNSQNSKNTTIRSVQQNQKENQYNTYVTNASKDFAAGNYDSGLIEAKQSLPLAQTDEEKAISHYWIGLFEYRKNDLTSCEAEMNEAISLKPNYAAPYTTLSAIAMDQNDFKKAETLARKSIEIDPDYAWAHNDLGLALLEEGKKAEGIKELEKAVQLAPDSYVFRDNLNRAKNET